MSVDLHLLHTDPKYQGREAGGMLIKRMLEDARENGLIAFLQSSADGHSLYKKHRFTDIEVQSLDFSKWGAEKTHDTWSMILEKP